MATAWAAEENDRPLFLSGTSLSVSLSLSLTLNCQRCQSKQLFLAMQRSRFGVRKRSEIDVRHFKIELEPLGNNSIHLSSALLSGVDNLN
jgi:hypothetical protein